MSVLIGWSLQALRMVGQAVVWAAPQESQRSNSVVEVGEADLMAQTVCLVVAVALALLLRSRVKQSATAVAGVEELEASPPVPVALTAVARVELVGAQLN
jgi:hypothetical protein